jgi:hypothetical protein
VPEDAGPEDAGPEDAGPEDAGPEDAGPEDVGTAPEDAGATPAEVATEADGAGVTADDEELAAVEHPATVTSTPVMATRAAKAGRTRRTTTDDTALSTPDLDTDTCQRTVPCRGSRCRPGGSPE